MWLEIIVGRLVGLLVSWEGCMWVEIILGWLDGFSVSWEGFISGLTYLLVGWVGC